MTIGLFWHNLRPTGLTATSLKAKIEIRLECLLLLLSDATKYKADRGKWDAHERYSALLLCSKLNLHSAFMHLAVYGIALNRIAMVSHGRWQQTEKVCVRQTHIAGVFNIGDTSHQQQEAK